MNDQPKPLLKLDRRLLAHIGALKKLVIAAAGFSALTAYPWAATVLLLLREVLTYYESVSIANNPID